LKKLNEITWKWLETVPYYIKCSSLRSDIRIPKLEFMQMNDTMAKIINFKANTTGEKSGFEFLDNMVSQDYIDIWLASIRNDQSDITLED